MSDEDNSAEDESPVDVDASVADEPGGIDLEDLNDDDAEPVGMDMDGGLDLETAAQGMEDLEGMEAEGGAMRASAFMGVPIEVLICVGKARPLVSDLVKLRRDSVISLDSRIDDPVEIYIGDRLIARGELQEMEDQQGQLGVRLTEVADLSNAV